MKNLNDMIRTLPDTPEKEEEQDPEIKYKWVVSIRFPYQYGDWSITFPTEEDARALMENLSDPSQPIIDYTFSDGEQWVINTKLVAISRLKKEEK